MVSAVTKKEPIPFPGQGNRFLNREISYLQFNERVLEIAESSDTPLLERAKFLAIFANNLDEFYMVRVAGLKRQQDAGIATLSADGLTPAQQLSAISQAVRPLAERHASVFCDEVMPALRSAGIRVLRYHDLSKSDRKEADTIFRERIFPILTPLAVDPGHPFPYISNRSLNLALVVKDRFREKTLFARVKVPQSLPRLLTLSRKHYYVPLEDVIAASLGDLFPGMKVIERHVFRVTRDSDLEMDDYGAEDLLSALEQELNRRRFSRAVRLEIEAGMPDTLLEMLTKELQLGREDVFELPGPLDLSFLFEMQSIDRTDLKDPPLAPATHHALRTPDDSPADFFTVLRSQDILVHHPYDSFATSVQAFIEQAAADPDVLAIKQTLYRTSGESPIVDSLIEAARAGKQVVVLVEIKARFDEVANIAWARMLERAGCHVVYGLVGLKTHCKLLMVVRREGETLRRYVHIGTGNYNPATARAYEDLGLLTADEDLGAEVGDLFNYLTGYSRHRTYASLIVAPHEMRKRIVSLIRAETEAAKKGITCGITFKLNNLVDEAVIDALCDASNAGVPIDIICRSVCALRPGVSGSSERIRVHSIVGRFLEHSRIYRFAAGGAEEIYIGSADMMHRNLDRRVEALVKVQSEPAKRRLRELLDLALRNTAGAWRLDGRGQWKRILPAPGEAPLDTQMELVKGVEVH